MDTTTATDEQLHNEERRLTQEMTDLVTESQKWERAGTGADPECFTQRPVDYMKFHEQHMHLSKEWQQVRDEIMWRR